jgi:Bacterial membrane protein YfhO
MKSPNSPVAPVGRWTSLCVVALISLVAQLALCQFFALGEKVPLSFDVNPSNLWKLGYHFPPTGTFQTLNWLGVAYLPQPLNPLSLAAAHLPPWLFFTAYTPIISTLALLAMAAFLREWELSRPAALFGGVIYAWQGDILPFVYPGHYGYITSWPFFAIAAWGALRAERTRQWAYAVISGACCGIMVGLLTNADRGGIDSLLIAALFLAPIFYKHADRSPAERLEHLRHFGICVAVAILVALAPLLALNKSNIENVKLAGTADREQTYQLVTQFSLAPSETLTYLVPGFFGWHINNPDGPYWGWIGESPDWPRTHQGTRNLNLAISTTGTLATVLALLGMLLLMPGEWMGPARLSDRQRFFARLLLALGFVALILSWGWHTPFYRPLFEYLPLMDKWRNPLKWVEIVNFALISLSALGLQYALRTLDPQAAEAQVLRRRLAWFTGILFLVLLGGVLASYPLAILYAIQFQNDGFDAHVIPNMMDAMHTSLIWAAVLIALFGTVLYLLWRPDPLRRLKLPNPWLQGFWASMMHPEYLPLTLALAVATLSAVQLGWVATQFVTPWPMIELTATNPLLEALRTDTNENHVRVTVSTDDPSLNTLLQNQFAAMNISCLDISAASRIPDDLGTFFATLGADRSRLWLLAGVKDVVVPQQLVPQMQQDATVSPNVERADGYIIAQTASPDVPSHALVTLKDYLAKATFVPNVEVLPEEQLLQKLKDPAWNPREKILLEKAAPLSGTPAEGTAATSDKIDLKTYSSTEIVIDAQTSRNGYILINDYYDPDWQVRVNGHAEPLLRADYLLRAVAIPAGKSEVTMSYVAHYHLGGVNLPAEALNLFSDAAMLAAWLVAAFALRRKSKAQLTHSSNNEALKTVRIP